MERTDMLERAGGEITLITPPPTETVGAKYTPEQDVDIAERRLLRAARREGAKLEPYVKLLRDCDELLRRANLRRERR